ncbi:ABC transporter substrate-binding protein [Nocardioides sp. TRM66260-LWL]|uniref:ABC transporter substrate-binding protein n=1 Tax=Nocardioides sp. TRM66260-LWL TaxID=2874478 RepID=UPI001CC42FE2|nr:ABC transporter substrate-binding protein [Nocardioides sp. TRM66260-LWL]MBZ5736010.1 ABC transporter substrate-binding protein [Nocardioides sp. TRM66260-LWL]
MRLRSTAPRRAAGLLAATVLTASALAGCASTADTAADPAASPTAGETAKDCAAKATLTAPGKLTVGTDSPAYEPWFSDDDPTNGKGFESAVAYAVADRLGFAEDAVSWTKVRFNTSYAPGAKPFDFDINQISITPARQKAVDFSDGYYAAAQAVIALKGSKAASITSLADLKDLRLGAQTGTTSLTAIRDGIQPTTEASVFQDTNAAKQALQNGQVDAILADLPTAFYITAVEIPKGTIVGQFQPTTGQQEEFGLLAAKGSSLTPCLDLALAELKADGTLAGLEKQWLSDVVDVPVLQ